MSNRILDSDKTKEQLIAELEAERDSKAALQQQVITQSAQLEKLAEQVSDRTQALRELEHRFWALVEQAPFPVQIYAPDGSPVLANKAWETMWCISRNQLEGYNLLSDSQLAAQGLISEIQRAFAGEVVALPPIFYSPALENNNCLGCARWVEAFFYPIADEAGTVREVVAVHLDAKERNSAEVALRRSEERLSCTILEAPLPIILHAEDGEILKVNQTWTDITGYTHSEIPTIAAWVEKAYGERGEDIKAAISCLYSLDKPQSAGESTITTCWGETRIWDFHCAPFGKTPDGRRLIFTTAFDVTERQQAEAALRESEKRLRLALDATKIGIWDGNVLTHRTTWSSRCEETFGFAPGTFDGTYEAFEACVHPEDRNCVRQSLNHVRESRQDYHQEFRIVWSDGSIHWLESKGKFFYNEAGEAVRILGTAMDISDRKLAEAALQKANEELENRVAQRTAELSQANECLQRELWERQFLEEKLRTSEAQMRGVFEAMTDIVLVLKTHTSASGISEIEDINVAPTNPTGLDNVTTDIIGKTVEQFFQGNRTETFLSQIRQALDARQTINFDYSLSIGNSEVWFAANISPLSEDSVIWVARDITVRKQIEEELKQSELWYRSLFESLPLLIWVADAQGHRYDFNQQCQNYQGMTEEEIKSFPWEKAIHPDDVELALTAWLESLQTGTLYEAKYRLRRADGVYRWHVERALPMYDQHEQILAWIGSCTDIDDLTQAKEAMQREKEFSERLIDSSVDGIFAFDRDCYYTVWNPGMERISGIGEAQIIGKCAWQVFPFLQEIGEDRFMRAVLAGESAIAKDRPYHVPQTGRSGFFEAYYSPLTNESGEIIGGLAIIRDITERHAVEQMKNEFISIVSHELRTPLTAIRGSLGILATGALNNHPQRMQRMIEIAAIDTERLVRLVNDILDLERLESGKAALVREYCDAAALMVRAAEAMRSLAQKENIILSVSPVSALVWASGDQIIQTLTNLLSNAIKFSPPNSTVTLTAQSQGDRILFQVKDRGRGIPPDQLESIFGRFQQVDASDSRLKGGTGLGLAICRNIITQHGGRIWAETVLGEGSTFYFTLPVSPDQP
jgi:PAS domain S-box-containing protein